MDAITDFLHRPSLPVALQCGELELQGFSIGGLSTYLMVPEWRVCFDMGDCPIEALRMNHVFLTHSHGDHLRGLLRHFSLRRMLNIPKASYHVPEQLVAPLRRLAQAWADLEGHRHHSDYIPEFQGLGTRDEVELNRQTKVACFPVDHRVRSLGYTVFDIRKKLKPQFQGVAGFELGALKKQGVAIEDITRIPRLTFIGDSTMKTLEREPHILDSEVLVLETTFLWEDDRDMATPKGHIHLDDLADFLRAHSEACRFQHLVLKHFSMKYTRAQIEASVRRRLPEEFLARTRLLI